MTRGLPTKVIIRRLPPRLKVDDFIKIVDPLPAHTYFKFCDADDSLGIFGLTRAYITFTDIDALFDFKERFDGYIFLDSEGNESSAIVEFAVCQALASAKGSSNGKKGNQVDKKQGTLSSDPDYLSFAKSVESVEATSETETESKKTPWEAILDELQNREADNAQTQTVTPLLAYLNNRDADIRRRDEESSRYRQFKQAGASLARKRVEKPLRIHPTARRGHDVKRNSTDRSNFKESSHHNNTKEGTTGTDSKTLQSNKSEKLAVVLNADEFPAMQSLYQRSNKVPNQVPDRSPVWVSGSSDSTGDKLSSPLSKNSANLIDLKEPTKILDVASDSKDKANHFDSEGSRPSERVTEPRNKELHTKSQVGQVSGSQNEPTFSECNSKQDNAFRAKKGSHYTFVNSVRKPSSKLLRSKRDPDANTQSYGIGNYATDEQENDYSHDRSNCFFKPGSRGRDNRRVTVTSHETYPNSSRDSHRGSQHISKETSGRSHDQGDSIRTEYYSEQHNGSARFSGNSRNSGPSSRGRPNSMGTGSYRRPGSYSSRGRGSGF
ncbi:unnamed protein product [Heterobilharzia americana]|nr:unnamed protein product [Heterobilharzia americana]CAH8655416.1 unnamed protein product [Heterobilharzia americana]